MRINSVSDCFQSGLFNRIESPLHGNALDILIFSNLPSECEVFWWQTRASNFPLASFKFATLRKKVGDRLDKVTN